MSDENKSEPKAVKDEKSAIHKKLFSNTVRLTVTLREPDEESCSVFNYISLIAEEKRKRRRERHELQVNGTVEETEEADDDVKRLAQHFEEKYGGSTIKKKKKKKAPTFYNYSELAAGYDENDSFIDNSEAFDEALPDEMETFHGGYYVNCGQLEFKKVELGDENSDLEDMKIGKKRSCVIKSDDSDSEADSVKSEEDESTDEDAESTNKKLPEETSSKENEVAKSKIVIEIPKLTEKVKTEKIRENGLNNVTVANGDLIKKRKKYKKRRRSEEGLSDEAPKPKKKSLTVKNMLEEKRVVENGDSTGNVPVPAVVVIKPTENVRNSINDVIESVVNAARHHSDDSRDSMCSTSDTKSIDSRTSYDTEKDSHHEEMEVTEASSVVSGASNIPKEAKMNDCLPTEVLDIVTQIKNSAQNSDFNIRTFFNPSNNDKLLNLETKLRPLTSSMRHAVYGHLAGFLPCSKDTLMKRAKKLLIEDEEKHMVEPFKKLKAYIDKVMPSLVDAYNAAYKFAVEENDTIRSNEMDEKKSTSSKLPQKRFVWSDEARNHLRDLVSCRLRCFHVLKPKKESSDDYVKKFLETKVKSLWPQGWMETSILWKETLAANNVVIKVKKPQLPITNVMAAAATTMSAPTTTTISSSNVVHSNKKSHISVPSSTNSSSNNNSSSNSLSAAATAATTYSNFLSNSLALQSIAMQYSPQSDVGYRNPSNTSIPYRTDLNMISAAAAAAAAFPPQSTALPLSMDLLSQVAIANTLYTSSHHAYSKSTSPPKKQSSSPVYSQRSTTPLSMSVQQSVSSFMEQNKIEKMSNEALSKYKEMIKMDSLLNSSKSKKEHHMLNHISQYNKHYSHKTEKRRSGHHEKKEHYTSSSEKKEHSFVVGQHEKKDQKYASLHEKEHAHGSSNHQEKKEHYGPGSHYEKEHGYTASVHREKKEHGHASVGRHEKKDHGYTSSGHHEKKEHHGTGSNQEKSSYPSGHRERKEQNYSPSGNQEKKMHTYSASGDNEKKVHSYSGSSDHERKEHTYTPGSQHEKKDHYVTNVHHGKKEQSVHHERKDHSYTINSHEKKEMHYTTNAKDSFTPPPICKSPINSMNISVVQGKSSGGNSKGTGCEILDLSPNKIKPEGKAESLVYQNPPEHNLNSDCSISISLCSNATAKDHNYWSSKKEDAVSSDIKDARHEKSTVLPNVQRVATMNLGDHKSMPQSVPQKPTHISRKQRILQETAKSAAATVQESIRSTSSIVENKKYSTQEAVKSTATSLKESTYRKESHSNSVPSGNKAEEKLPTIIEEKKPPSKQEEKLVEETTTATDILSKIINESLQDNNTFHPQFSNSLFSNNRIKKESKIDDVETLLNEKAAEIKSCPPVPPVGESHTPSVEKSFTVNSERKTPSNELAEIDTADVVNDLFMLNQIGARSSSRRPDYQDSRYIDNRHLNSDMNFSSNSMLNQSSPHNSNNKTSSSIPRMNLKGFQDEFLQHIFKRDTLPNNSLSQDCFSSSDVSSTDNNKLPLMSHNLISSTSPKPGHAPLYNFHQTVIMPPPSVKWPLPESKS